nr:MAG TPA: hypothetical protein [Caudoviricetes sp.]
MSPFFIVCVVLDILLSHYRPLYTKFNTSFYHFLGAKYFKKGKYVEETLMDTEATLSIFTLYVYFINKEAKLKQRKGY